MTPDGLVGEWRLRRRVVDYRLGWYGRMEGELVVAQSEGGALLWHEQGRLQLNGLSHSVTRDLRLADGPDGWWVSFDDGRPFHPWRVGEPVRHLCGADMYDGLFDLRGDRLRILWDVSGPAKTQRLVTRLDRLAE